MSYERKPSLLLCELWERESASGNVYFAGFLGGLSVALLRDGEREHPSRPGETVTVWRLVAQERQPRQETQGTSRQPRATARADTPPAARGGAARRPSNGSRKDRAARDTLERLGNPDLDDAIPF